jgi:hypothetical protein
MGIVSFFTGNWPSSESGVETFGENGVADVPSSSFVTMRDFFSTPPEPKLTLFLQLKILLRLHSYLLNSSSLITESWKSRWRSLLHLKVNLFICIECKEMMALILSS